MIEMFELPDAEVKVDMICEECNHIQTVKGRRLEGAYFFGSGFDFCDKCDGLPIYIEGSLEVLS
jgi:hypothetical protein